MKPSVLSTLFLLFPAMPAADESVAPRTPACVESVVIARIARVGELLDYSTDTALVLHSPSVVDLRITRVFYGTRPPCALTTITRPVRLRAETLFLLGRREGRWLVLGFEPRVARDRQAGSSCRFSGSHWTKNWNREAPRDYRERLREILCDPERAAT